MLTWMVPVYSLHLIAGGIEDGEIARNWMHYLCT